MSKKPKKITNEKPISLYPMKLEKSKIKHPPKNNHV